MQVLRFEAVWNMENTRKSKTGKRGSFGLSGLRLTNRCLAPFEN